LFDLLSTKNPVSMIFVLALSVGQSHAQFSKINSISLQQSGVDVSFFSYPFKLNFSGCTVGQSGNIATVTCGSAVIPSGTKGQQVIYTSSTTIGGQDKPVCDTRDMAGADVGARINACTAKIGFTIQLDSFGNQAHWVGTPGVIYAASTEAGAINTQVVIPSNQTLHLGCGTFTNSFGEFVPPIAISDNSMLEGEGWCTIVKDTSQVVGENPVVGMTNSFTCSSPAPPPCGAGGCEVNCSRPPTTGVIIRDIHFKSSGSTSGTSLAGILHLSQCVNCRVLNNWFDGFLTTAVTLVGANVLSSPHPDWIGIFGHDDEIAGNVITGPANAGISIINNRTVHIHHNTFRDHGPGAAAYIDLESNQGTDYMEDIDVSNNIFDCSKPQANTGCLGITLQSVGPNVGQLKFHDNIYFGPPQDAMAVGQSTGGIGGIPANLHGVRDVEIYNNYVSNTNQGAIGIAGTDNGWIHDNHVICSFNGAITLNQGVQHSIVERNHIYSPEYITFNVTSVATSSGGQAVYTGTFTGGASQGIAWQTFTVAGFTNAANNGIFGALDSTATTLTLTNANAVAETHAATASTGCGTGEKFLYQEQKNTSLSEVDATDDYNIFRDNIGAGETIIKGAHSIVKNTEAANALTDGSAQTFQIPTGFAVAIPGAMQTGQLLGPVLSQQGPVSAPASCPSLAQTTYFFIVTAVDVAGGEVPSNEISFNAGGAFGCPHPGWNYVPGAASYKYYRGTSSGTEVFQDTIPQGTLGYADAGGQTPGAAVPTTNTTGNLVIAHGGSASKAICWKADGKTLGFCSTQPDSTGACTCN
jgi:hypothetical protein